MLAHCPCVEQTQDSGVLLGFTLPAGAGDVTPAPADWRWLDEVAAHNQPNDCQQALGVASAAGIHQIADLLNGCHRPWEDHT